MLKLATCVTGTSIPGKRVMIYCYVRIGGVVKINGKVQR